MKKLLRRWLSIDEILERQNDIDKAIRDREEAHDNLAQCIDGLLDLKFDDNFEKLEDNTKRINSMILELKGVVAMARAVVSEGKTKPTSKHK